MTSFDSSGERGADRPGQDLWGQQPRPTPAPDGRWERELLERLAFASLNEQKAARRSRIFWRLVWLGLVLAALWLVGREGAAPTASSAHTAVVEIKGEIASGAN